jgi:signal transduction histidine kinase
VGFVLAYTLFSAVAVAGFGFSLFRRRLIGPIRSLQIETDRIAAGDFGHTISIDAATEIQALAQALNTMSLSLQGYRSRTAEQMENLERANDDLRAAQEALVRSERLAGVGRLAAGLAHELGNPLAAVSGNLELLAQGLQNPELEADLLARARRENDRMHDVLQQLLGYARTGTGEMEILPTGIALHEAAITVRAHARRAGLKVEVGRTTGVVCVERDKLHQVLVNILLNAIDAMAGSEGKVVHLHADEGPDAEGSPGAFLHCVDTGHGFDGVALDRACEPFFTTKDVGEGTGLGLSTCAQVLDAAGGTISLSNRKEGGACVSVWLPASSS